MRDLVLSTAMLWAAFAAGTGWAQHPRTPPPVPDTVDHQPGPYIVYPDARGAIDDAEMRVLVNATRNWSDTQLSAFLICYRSDRREMRRQMAHAALNAVASALKTHGAKVVVMPSGGRCDRPREASPAALHVEIMGMVQR